MGHNLQIGEVKNTLGTGSFLLMNTGSNIINSSNGLLTTVLYKSFDKDTALYALEGAVETAGSAIEWLKDSLNIFEDYEDLKEKFNSVPDNGGVIFVPAFSGLFTPHWDLSARGMIIGLTHGTKKGNIIRATYEAISLRCNEAIRSFQADSKSEIVNVKVDGGVSESDELLQTMSNVCTIQIVKQKEKETTILGSAIVAGLHPEIALWTSEDICKLVQTEKVFNSEISKSERDSLISKWEVAIERAKNWV
jgi:glycerol kinase